MKIVLQNLKVKKMRIILLCLSCSLLLTFTPNNSYGSCFEHSGIYAPLSTGVIDTAQGRVEVVCDYDRIVVVTVKDQCGIVKLEEKEMEAGDTLSLKNLSPGTYKVEARFKGSSTIQQRKTVVIK